MNSLSPDAALPSGEVSETSASTRSAYDAAILEEKVTRVFGSLAIDKRRLEASKLKSRGVPAYVAEWVIDTVAPGSGPLSLDDAAKLGAWAARVIPKADDGNAIKHRLQMGEQVKLLTQLEVEVVLTRGREDRFARLPFVGILDAHIPDDLVAKNPELLKGGMWGVVELMKIADGPAVTAFRPMQASVNLGLWREARREYSLEEWRALLLISMGYNPQAFTGGEQMLLLCRLLPLVQKNLHLMELAPKGTGKSYVYENISPRVRLISGGNVSPAVLFVNNATGQAGILARYAVVVLDEVQTLKFEKPEEIIGSLKGYLANGRIARGGKHEIASDCGFVLLANITLDKNQQPTREPLVAELPAFLQETAFLDRLRGLVPGWQIRKLGSASFAASSGLKSDFFGDVLVALRDELEADQFCNRRIELLGERPYRRNEESIRLLASGFMKLLFPHGEVSDEEFLRHCVKPATRLRQGVWDQLYYLDAEYRQYERELRCRLAD